MTTRATGVLALVGGIGLSAVSYLLVLSFVDHAIGAGLDVPEGPRHLRLIGALPALGMAGGMVLAYVGAVRVVLGDRVAGLDMTRITPAGAAYAAGFAATLVAAIWIGVSVFDMNPFGG